MRRRSCSTGAGSVLPALRRRGASGDAGLGDERHRAHRSMRHLLGLLAEDEPVVLVLDDLHWSDAGSVDLIGALVRRGMAPGVLLALGHRTGRAPAALVSALTAREVTFVALDPLGEDECRSLTGDGLPATRHTEIFRQSGGNPFYALQLAAAAAGGAQTPAADTRMAAQTGVPRAVAAALVDELGSVGATARTLLDAGAVAGDPFEPDLAFAIAELTDDDGSAALDELLGARLLHPTAVPRSLRVPPSARAPRGVRIQRRGLAASRPRSRRRGAGGTRRGTAQRAHHVEECAAAGDAEAIAVLLDAAAATAPRAPATAAHWLEAALRLLPETDRAAQLRIRIALARALRSTGDLEGMLRAAPGGDRPARAVRARTRIALTAACAASEHFLGRHEEATRRLEAAFAGLPDPESEEAVVALLALTAGAFFALEPEQGRAASRQALAVARALDRPILVFATAGAVAHACANAGAIEEAASALDVAADLMDGLPDDELAAYLDAVNRLAWAEHLVERDADAVRHAERGIAIARRTGQDQFVPAHRGSRGPEPAAAGRRDARGPAAGGGARDGRGRRQRLRHLVGPDDRGPDPCRAGRSPGCAGSRRAGRRAGRAPRGRPDRDDGPCAARAAAPRGGRARRAPRGPRGGRGRMGPVADPRALERPGRRRDGGRRARGR